ncbi:MAG: transglutaminaseTgpA domain-containing protein, partial [Bryobacteraceae bacterium]
LAVAGSGFLDLPTIILTGAGLVWRTLMVAGVWKQKLAPRWVNAATLAYIGFYPIDYLYVSRDFITATIHLIFFLAIVRVLTAQTDRDYFFVKLIAFLELLAATLLSPHLNFFLFLTLFLIFGVATFCSSEIRRSAQSKRRLVRAGGSKFYWRLAFLSGSVAAAILVMTAGLFFLLPRTAHAAFRHLIAQQYFLPGFSNEVTLGQTGQIQQQSATVMHIRVDDGDRQYHVKWRGASLSRFDGKRWYNPPAERKILRTKQGQINLANDLQRRRAGVRISYEVNMKGENSDEIFITGVPEFLRVNLPMIVRSADGSYRTGLGFSDGMRYFGWSLLPDLKAQTEAEEPLSAQERISHILLPPQDPRIAALARRLVSGEPSEMQQARNVENYLRTEYSYTTDLLETPVADPLAHFLFERKKGHCEYFASAMAVLLRSAGIPSRVVTGFQSGIFNPMTGWHVIRASDAHSWVEAYLPETGWTTFDPTPPDPGNGRSTMLRQLALYMDAAETFW